MENRKTRTRRRTPRHPITVFIVNGAMHGLSPPPRQALPSRDGQWWLFPWLAGAVLSVHLCPHPINVLRLRWCFLKKKIISVRKESRVWERDFENFQVKERMKVIKEIHEYFGRFFYQEENFNFSPFRRKLNSTFLAI